MKLRGNCPLEHDQGIWIKTTDSGGGGGSTAKPTTKLNNRELTAAGNNGYARLRPGDILSFGHANFYTCVLVEPGKPTNLQQRVEVAKRYVYDVQQQNQKPPPLPAKQAKKPSNHDTDGGTVEGM